LRLLFGIILILATSCTDIFKTELPPIKDCTGDNDICSYNDSIQPIFNSYCTVCHHSASFDTGLSLESRSDLFSSNVVIASDSLNSKLRQRLTGELLPIMPQPPYENLEISNIHMIAKWIQAGALEN